MANFGILFLCFFAGILLQFYPRFPKNTPVVLNQFVLTISVPALILTQFHHANFNSQALIPILMPWALFLVSYCLFRILGATFNWGPKQIGALILTTGLGNTGFIGIPMIEAIYGPDSIQVGMLSDQLGSFIILSTLGIGVSGLFSGKKVSSRKLLEKVLTFPPTIAILVAALLKSVTFYPWVEEMFSRIAGTITPLALVSVGFQLKFNSTLFRLHKLNLFWGLLFKLVLAPALFCMALVYGFNIHSRIVDITIVESAMAPMISAAILVSEAGLDSELANLMVGIGVPLSFLTVPLWAYLLSLVSS